MGQGYLRKEIWPISSLWSHVNLHDVLAKMGHQSSSLHNTTKLHTWCLLGVTASKMTRYSKSVVIFFSLTDSKAFTKGAPGKPLRLCVSVAKSLGMFSGAHFNTFVTSPILLWRVASDVPTNLLSDPGVQGACLDISWLHDFNPLQLSEWWSYPVPKAPAPAAPAGSQ